MNTIRCMGGVLASWVQMLSLACCLASGAAIAESEERLIVLSKSDDEALFVDLGSGREAGVLPTGREPHEVAVSPDGAVAVITNYGGRADPGNSLTLIDLTAGSVLRELSLGEFERPHGITFLPDGKRVLVTAEERQSLVIVDLEAGNVEASLNTGQEISHMVAMTPDARRAFVANIGSGNVSAFDLESHSLLATVATGRGAEGIAVTPNGREVWVSNRAEDTLTVLDTQSLETLAQIKCGSFPIRIVFTPDGAHALVSNARSGDVAMFDVATRREVHRFALGLEAGVDTDERLFRDAFGKSPVPIGLLVHPKGRHAYVAASNADRVIQLDLKERRVTGSFPTGRQPDGLGFVSVP